MENTEQPKTAPADIVSPFVDVKDHLPDEGQSCEVLREVCYYGATGYCRFRVERTTYQGNGAFLCDIAGTGIVRGWRPAEGIDQPAALGDYAGLDALLHEKRNGVAISALATSEKVHPGYGGKPEPAICTDCVHFMVTYREQAGCAHPSVGVTVNPVDGHKTPNALCTKMRADGSACGPDGLLYAPTDEAIRRPVCKNLIRKPFQLRISTPACTVDSSLWPSESANPSKEIACSGCAFSPNSR